MVKKLLLAFSLLSLAFVSAGCQKLRARDNLNKGVQAFKASKFSEAVDYFKQATDLDPEFVTARLYLAMAYMSQWIPGAESAENSKFAASALDQFQKVLAQDPKDKIATASIASIYFNQKDFDKAEEWNRKMIALDANSKEAYYTLGVIAWTRWVKVDLEERTKMGMKRDDPGPLKDKKVKAALKPKWMPVLDQGIQDMKKALEIDPNYDEAMAYMNLLIRYRADLVDTPEEYKKESEIADNWVNKSMETQKANAAKKAEAAAKGPSK
jgi:Tfp pilus assembly protein PilF